MSGQAAPGGSPPCGCSSLLKNSDAQQCLELNKTAHVAEGFAFPAQRGFPKITWFSSLLGGLNDYSLKLSGG